MISAAERRQFTALYRVFLLRIVDSELLSSQGDVSKVLGQLAAVLAAVSFTFTLIKVPQYALAGEKMSPGQLRIAAWADQEFLIATTMAVAALILVVAWNSLFPSRMDMLALGAAPVRRRTLLVAKASVVATAVLGACTAMHAFTGIAYPLLVMPVDRGWLTPLRSVAAFWVTLLAAAVTVACALAALQGLAALVLPYRWFVRASAYLQILCIFGIITIYLLQPPLSDPTILLRQTPSWVTNNPSVWFVGLFQRLNGAAHPVFYPLSERAVVAIVGTGVAAIVTFVFGSLRAMKGIVAYRHVVSSGQPGPLVRAAMGAARWFSPQVFERTLVLFAIRTLVRSRQHRLLFAAWSGAGIAMALVFVRESLYRPDTNWFQPSLSLLGVGFVLLFFLIVGIRSLATIPFELRANWIFRITEFREPVEYLRAMRRTMMLTAAVPTLLFLTGLYGFVWQCGVAGRHLILLAVFTSITVNLALVDFRKLPFACSYLPGKAKLNVRIGAYALAFVVIADAGLRIELWALANSGRYLQLLGFGVAMAWWAARRARRAMAASPGGLVFDDLPPVDLLSLHLGPAGHATRPLQRPSAGGAAPAVPWRTRMLRVVVIALLLITGGVAWQHGAEWLDRRRFPRVGRSVDIGGRSLNLHCLGDSRGPVVVFDSGLNVPGYSWVRVQAEVAKFARACWFDRAGYGWSDPAPPPRTSAANAEDLHRLLHVAGLPAPYVLVGHSYGGFNTRVFAGRYREEVAALVLVDSAYEDDETDLRLRVADPPLKRLLPAGLAGMAAAMWPYAARLGVVRLFADSSAPHGKLRSQDAAVIQALQLQSKSVDAFVQEGIARRESTAQVRAIRSLGDLPLIVITGGKIAGAPDFSKIWVEEIQAGFLRLSSRAMQVVVPGSGHAVPYEAPEAIASSIHDLVLGSGGLR